MPRTKETKGRRLSRVMPAAIIAASVFIPAARAENQPMTVVYALDSANLTFRDSDAANINQINYAFALIRDGEAVGSHWAAIDRVRAYLRKHPHIRGVMAVGGWGASPTEPATWSRSLATATASPTMRRAWSSSIW